MGDVLTSDRGNPAARPPRPAPALATRWLRETGPAPSTSRQRSRSLGERPAAEDAPQVVSAGPREAAQPHGRGAGGRRRPPPLAQRVAYLTALVPVLDLVEIGTATDTPFEDVCRVYFADRRPVELALVHARKCRDPRVHGVQLEPVVDREVDAADVLERRSVAVPISTRSSTGTSAVR